MRGGAGPAGGRGGRILRRLILFLSLLLALAARAETQDGPRVLAGGPVRVAYWAGGQPRAE
ncbi:MAG: hypothetical protein M3P24_02060, partial [Gemmatimonadota bacterium]|nr:hypothetical protein [Gemmatimonadota bacterium]